jgi:putative NIF3 family GTP cyclohydrolase 1 type 2
MDINLSIGHAAGWARALELQDVQSAFSVKGLDLGLTGRLASPLTMDGVLNKLSVRKNDLLGFWNFGKQEISTVGILSGSGIKEFKTALRRGLDLFITGDLAHEQYFPCLEEKLNVISLGHYQSEIPGLKSLMELSAGWALETCFIDLPTRL